MYTQTPKDQKAAVVLFHAMLWVASLDGMEAAGATVVDALKEKWYLQPKEIWGQTFAYNFKARERDYALEGEELVERINTLDIALDDAADHIDDIEEVLAAYAEKAGL